MASHTSPQGTSLLIRVSVPSFCLTRREQWLCTANWIVLNMIFTYALFDTLLVGRIFGAFCLLFSIPLLVWSIARLISKHSR